MANQSLQERLEQDQKKLLEELNASNFLKEINNPERKNWFWYQPNERGTYKGIFRNDPLAKYIKDLNSSNKERILKATSEEKLNEEIKKLKNKIAASPRYNIKYAGLLEGPFEAKPQISGAVEWFFKVSTVIAIVAIVITSSASLGFLPILISSLVAPACYAAMRGTRGLMFRTQQNDLLETSKLELELETFQAKINALEEQQEFFRNDVYGKKYVKNLTTTLNSDLVQKYSKLGKNDHIKNNLLKYNGKDKSTLNQLKANLTTLIDTNKFVEYNKDNQTLQKNINLDFDKNERIIKAVQALVDSKLAEDANAKNENGLDLSEATFLTPKDSNSTYIISKNKVYRYANGNVIDTELVGGNDVNKKIAIYEELGQTYNIKDLEKYIKALNNEVTAKGISDIDSILNTLNNTSGGTEQETKQSSTEPLNIPDEQLKILKQIAEASNKHLAANSIEDRNTLKGIISGIYNKQDNESSLDAIDAFTWAKKEAAKAKTAAEAAKTAEEATTEAEAAKTPAEEIKALLQKLKDEVNKDKGTGTQEQQEIQKILKSLQEGEGGIPEPENISNLFGEILNSAQDIQEPLIGEMRNLGISLKPENNIKLPSTMSHIQEKHNKGR